MIKALFKSILLSLICFSVIYLLTGCASSKPKTVDEVYEKYGSKAVYERPYSDEEIRYQEQARQQQEKDNLQKALEAEQAKNKVLQSQIQKEDVKPIKVAPPVRVPAEEVLPEENKVVVPVKEANPASQDLNFSNPLGE